jgi:hypothetical protein
VRSKRQAIPLESDLLAAVWYFVMVSSNERGYYASTYPHVLPGSNLMPGEEANCKLYIPLPILLPTRNMHVSSSRSERLLGASFDLFTPLCRQTEPCDWPEQGFWARHIESANTVSHQCNAVNHRACLEGLGQGE